jgi:hypothetical protein
MRQGARGASLAALPRSLTFSEQNQALRHAAHEGISYTEAVEQLGLDR